MSQASIKKFSSFMEGTVLAMLATPGEKLPYRKDLNKVDLFMDLSSKNLTLGNPTTFGSSHLTREEQRNLMALFRKILSDELRGLGAKPHDYRTIVGNPKRYNELTRGSKAKGIVYILLERNKHLLGVLAASPIANTNDVFRAFKAAMTTSANKLDVAIQQGKHNSEVRSVDRNKPTEEGYKSLLDIGHIGLGDAVGRTPN